MTREELQERASKNLIRMAQERVACTESELALEQDARQNLEGELQRTVESLVATLAPLIGRFPNEVRVLVPEAVALHQENEVLRAKVGVLQNAANMPEAQASVATQLSEVREVNEALRNKLTILRRELVEARKIAQDQENELGYARTRSATLELARMADAREMNALRARLELKDHQLQALKDEVSTLARRLEAARNELWSK